MSVTSKLLIDPYIKDKGRGTIAKKKLTLMKILIISIEFGMNLTWGDILHQLEFFGKTFSGFENLITGISGILRHLEAELNILRSLIPLFKKNVFLVSLPTNVFVFPQWWSSPHECLLLAFIIVPNNLNKSLQKHTGTTFEEIFLC
jgi:hypothetical protein